MSKPVTNTATEEKNVGWLMGGNPNAIEAQEARGQRELESSTQLPSEGSNDPAWAKMGVIFGEPTRGDPLFRSATLPAGWTKKATDHSMWLKLYDEKGRERARIFYKAAFYDRKAHIRPTRRFDARSVYVEGRGLDHLQYEVTDCARQVFVTDVVFQKCETPEDWEKAREIEKVQRQACIDWVSSRFPQWEDAAAHWDDEGPVPLAETLAK